MPRKLDPAKTRQLILESALSCFAERGYNGASMSEIAKLAGVQKSLLQYHFGTKEGLWQACLAHRAAPVIEALDGFIAGKVSASDLIDARMKVLSKHPEVGRLLAWASMEPVPMPSFIAQRREGVLGRFHADACGQECLGLLFAIAAMDGWFLFRNLYRHLVGDSILGPEAERQLLARLLEQR